MVPPPISNAEGKFRFEGLPPAEYILFATDTELEINLHDRNEVEYWQQHGQHLKPELGISNHMDLEVTLVPTELYPK